MHKTKTNLTQTFTHQRAVLAIRTCVVLLICFNVSRCGAQTDSAFKNRKSGSVRFATFNVSLNRRTAGALAKELAAGESEQASKIAAIIQTVRPDVILLNEVDFDGGKSVAAFEKNFLAKPQFDQPAISYKYRYVAPVNTGVDSALDLNEDGKFGGPDDAFGFGAFPGQYGMAILSNYPIEAENVRTFQTFLWQDMPGALLPTNPVSGKLWYSARAMKQYRLSSKSHWDVPISVEGSTIHLLASHPTPPVFDGDEDRNGKRNHDEIRLWADYIGDKADYLYDDNGNKGGLKNEAHFIIAGDLNADPNDGDSTNNAVSQLLDHARVAADPIPTSDGGSHYAKADGQINLKHTGDAAFDTANFNDANVGNVRIDYVLPSKTLGVSNQGVFWPKPKSLGNEWTDASDHRMVWIDVEAK